MFFLSKDGFLSKKTAPKPFKQIQTPFTQKELWTGCYKLPQLLCQLRFKVAKELGLWEDPWPLRSGPGRIHGRDADQIATKLGTHDGIEK